MLPQQQKHFITKHAHGMELLPGIQDTGDMFVGLADRLWQFSPMQLQLNKDRSEDLFESNEQVEIIASIIMA